MAVGEVAKSDGKWLPAFHWHHKHYPAGFYTDADALEAYQKSEDKRKFVTEPAEQRAAANKKRWSSAKTWGKAITNVASLDEESWTAMIEKGGDGLLEDADKTSDVEWAIQLTLLAAIVVGAKAGSKTGESRGVRANTERVTAEEIRAEAREQGIDLPDDTGFQMRLNELAREFNTMPEEQKNTTLRDINKGNVNKAQAEYNQATTPIDRLRAKTKLDRVKKELAKFEGEYGKKEGAREPLKGKSGFEGEGGGFLDVFDEEAAEKEPLLEKEKAKKESDSKGLLDLPAKLNKKGGSLLDKLRKQGEEKKREEAGKDPIKSDKLEEELEDGEEGGFEGEEQGEELKEDPKPSTEKGKMGKSKINPEGAEGTGGSGKPKIVPETRSEKETRIKKEKAEENRINDSLYSKTWEEYAQERETNAQRGRNAFAESWQSQNAREMGKEEFNKRRGSHFDLIEKEKAEKINKEKAEKNRIEESLYSRTWEEYAQERETNAQRGRNAFAESWESQNAREMGKEAFEKARNDYMQKQLTKGREKPELEDDDILDFDFDEDLDQPFDRDEQNKFRYENEEVDVDFDENLDGYYRKEEMNLEEEIFEDPEETDALLGETREGDVIELDEENNTKTRADMTPSTRTAATLLGAASGITSVIAETQGSSVTPQTQAEGGSKPDEDTGGVGAEINAQFKIKNTLNTKNLDELLRLSLKLTTMAYETGIVGTPELYEISAPLRTDTYNLKEENNINILFHKKRGVLYVTIRGTANMANVLLDLNENYLYLHEIELFKKITDLNQSNDIQVHSGFAQGLASIYELIRNEIDKYLSGTNIVFSGHSFGAAIATILYFVYQHDIMNKEKKRYLKVQNCITWGSPKFLINNEIFIQRYKDTCPHVIRVWNTNDPVTYLPNYLFGNKIPTVEKSPLSYVAMSVILAGYYYQKKIFSALDSVYTQLRNIDINDFEVREDINVLENTARELDSVIGDLQAREAATRALVDESPPQRLAINELELTRSGVRRYLARFRDTRQDIEMNEDNRAFLSAMERARQTEYESLLVRLKNWISKYSNVVKGLSLSAGALWGLTNQEITKITSSMFGPPKSVVHVGKSLCLDGDIDYNNINNLIAIIAQDSISIYKEIDKEMKPTPEDQEAIYKMISSKEFRAMILSGTLKCIPYTEDLTSQNPLVVARFVYDNIKNLETYQEKCQFLKPLLLNDYFKSLPLSNIAAVQNYALSTLTGIYVNAVNYFNTGEHGHTLNTYNFNLNNLIKTEVNEHKSIFNLHTNKTIGLDKNITEAYSVDKLREDETFNRMDKFTKLPMVIGIYHGEFDNYDFVEY